MYSAIAKNKFNTILIIALFVLILGALGAGAAWVTGEWWIAAAVLGGAKDDDAAVAEFVKRMRAMESVCRERGERIRALVEKEDRPAVERIALESANDAARLLADVLHTLGALAPAKTGGAALSESVLVTETGPELLTHLPRGLLVNR